VPIALANAGVSPGFSSPPSQPCRTISVTPPAAAAIIGRVAAIPSTIIRLNNFGSVDVCTIASIAFIHAGTAA
jgi:hypothetical protein